MGYLKLFLAVWALENGEKLTTYDQNSPLIVACVNDIFFLSAIDLRVLGNILRLL